MRKHSAEDRFSLFYRAGVISAHANAGGKGFRQKDFLFLVDLMFNWASLSLSFQMKLHNTQALRFLDQLVQAGYAKRTKRDSAPYYRLTRLGLLELVSLMTAGAEQLDAREFYFLFYFISSYKERIEQLIAAEGSQFPSALRLEILGLLDAEELLRRALKKCDNELEKMESRITETLAGARLYEEQRRMQKSVLEAAALVEKRYPYQLNSQKPLSKLIGEIPIDIAEAELSVNARRRVELMFQPARQILLRHRDNLRQMIR